MGRVAGGGHRSLRGQFGDLVYGKHAYMYTVLVYVGLTRVYKCLVMFVADLVYLILC